MFSGSIERKHRPKIDQYIQEATIVGYGLFVEFEINLIFDTSREGSFGKTLKFCWGLKGGISYEIIIIHRHLFNRELFYILLACESIRNAYPTEFFPVVSWSTHSSRKFDFFCFGISKLAWAHFLLALFCFVRLCINKPPSDGVTFLQILQCKLCWNFDC